MARPFGPRNRIRDMLKVALLLPAMRNDLPAISVTKARVNHEIGVRAGAPILPFARETNI